MCCLTKLGLAFKGQGFPLGSLNRLVFLSIIIADNASGHFMRSGQVNIVFVGSDRTAANGDVANKIGTYNVAVLAKENGIPFYPVVPTSTIDLQLATGDLIPIEERNPDEVRAPYGLAIVPDDYLPGIRLLM